MMFLGDLSALEIELLIDAGAIFCWGLLLCDFLPNLLFDFVCLDFCFLSHVLNFCMSLFGLCNLFFGMFSLSMVAKMQGIGGAVREDCKVCF